MNNTSNSVPYLPLLDAIRSVGIGKTKAYELMAQGLIETFLIGTKRYIVMASLYDLPNKLAAAAKKADPLPCDKLSRKVKRAPGMRGVR